MLDVIAPSKPLASAVLANFGSIAGKSPVNVHPVAARQVDPEVLKVLQGKAPASKEAADGS